MESGGNPLAKDNLNKMPRDYAQESGQDLCLEFLQKQSGETRHKTAFSLYNKNVMHD